jgi:hypothetical protein
MTARLRGSETPRRLPVAHGDPASRAQNRSGSLWMALHAPAEPEQGSPD